MKRIIASALIVSFMSIGLVGCDDKTSSKQETTIETPGGTTTITTEKEVKKSGDNPSPAAP